MRTVAFSSIYTVLHQRDRWTLLVLLGLLAFSAGARAAPLPGAAGEAPSLAKALNPDGTLRPGTVGSFDARQFVLRTAPDGHPSFRPVSAQSSTGTGDEKWRDDFTLPGTNGTVLAVVQLGNDVYIGGAFTVAGNTVANNIAKWNGTSWSALDTGVSGGYPATLVRSLAVVGTDLYAGGSFVTAGGVSARNIAKWNGTSWSALGTGSNNGTDGPVACLAVSGTRLYVGGDIGTVGGTLGVNDIACWNGTTWSALGAGVGGNHVSVSALAVMGTTLYAGGDFTSAGGVPANHLAKWNGTAWSAVSADSPSSTVYCLAAVGTDLYVGGNFATVGSLSALHIAKWSGTAWSALVGVGGTRNGTNDNVTCLAVRGTDLYVGGTFSVVGDILAANVAKWDGSTWSTLGGANADGVSGGVAALGIAGSDLYVGGSIGTYANGYSGNYTVLRPVNNIAKWSGTAWSSLTPGCDGTLNAVVVAPSGDVYVGGAFTRVGDVVANNVARWNGSTWNSLGTGAANGLSGGSMPIVYALLLNGPDLYAGGTFVTAGGAVANRVARWNGTSWSALGTGTGTTNGMTGYVYALAMSGTDLYVGGTLTAAGSVSIRNIARWDGAAWNALTSGTTNGVNSAVYALAARGTDLYVGGYFSQAGSSAISYLARWNGTAWSAVGATGLNGGVQALLATGSVLYAGGTFTQAGGAAANHVAQWNGTTWAPVGSGLANGVNDEVLALTLAGTDLYVGGRFTQAGSLVTSRVARWDGTAWNSLGTGLGTATADVVRAIGVRPNQQVAIGGNFLSVGDGSKVSAYFAVYDPQAVLATVPAALAQQVALYPNPAKNSAYLELPASLGRQPVTATLVDAVGHQVRLMQLPAQGAIAHSLDLRELPTGVYTLCLQTSAGTLVKRLTVE